MAAATSMIAKWASLLGGVGLWTLGCGGKATFAPTPVPSVSIDALRPEAALDDSVAAGGKGLRVVARNLNPFVYAYRLTVNETAAVGVGPDAFFKVAGLGITLPEQAQIRTSDTVVAEFAIKSAAADTLSAWFNSPRNRACLPEVSEAVEAQATTVLLDLRTREEHVHLRLGEYQTLAEAVQERMSGATREFRRHARVVLTGTASADILQRSAREVVELLDQLDDFLLQHHTKLEGIALSYRAVAGPMAAQAKAATSAFPKCHAIGLLSAQAALLAADTARQQAWAARVDSVRASAVAQADSLRPLAHDAERFQLVAALASVDPNSDIEVTLERKPVGTADERYAPLIASKIEVAGPWRFSIGGGLGLTNSGTTRYVTAPATSEGSRPSIARARDDVGLLPYVWLNTKVYRRVGFLVGVGAKVEGNTSPDLVVGGSVALWRDRFGLFLGGVFGREQRLPMGLSRGDELPPGLDELTSVQVRRFAWLLGANYTVR